MAENPMPPVVPQLTLPVPQRKDPTNFRLRADVLMTELPLVVGGINGVVAWVNGVRDATAVDLTELQQVRVDTTQAARSAGESADNAEGSATLAVQSAIEAAASADSVQIKEQEREQIFEDSQEERNNRFSNFITSSGYQFLGDYAAGIEITEYNQIVRDSDGEFWRLSGQAELPYTTTGAGLPEGDALTPLGDAVLRQDLANPDKGAEMVGYGDGTVADKLDEIVSGAVTEPLVDAKVDTHNQDVHAHPELRTRIVSEVSSHVTLEADRAEAAAESVKPYVDSALSDLSTAASKFYPTLALANADIANILVNQPIHVGEAVNGGLWYKATSGATTLTKSAYDPLTQAKNHTDSKVVTDNSDEFAHAFIDVDGKLLASIDADGKFDFDPSESAKERLGVLVGNGDADYAFLFVDAENKVLGGWDKYGNDMSSKGVSEPTDSFSPAPLTHEKSAVEITDFSRVIEKLNINTIAKGRTTDPDVVLNGNGFTHPKLVYVPESWNGYKYWLAVTPTFGITPSDAYENPHVFCSNDMLTWLEPTGAPIDLPDPSSSVGYWSDTHLVIDDDGWMYCFYRGNYFYGHATRFIVARKTRDGVNWSDRIPIYDPVTGGVDNSILSPAIYKNGSKWQYIDILKDPENEGDFQFNTNYGRGVFRRSADTVTGDYGTYTLDHLVNITNRPWGEDNAPWHIDAIKVGNLYLLLLAVGGKTQSYSHELYLCWSTDGWNYTAFDKLNTLYDNCYRSSISFRDYKDGKINFDVIVARTTGSNGGNLDLFNLTLETK